MKEIAKIYTPFSEKFGIPRQSGIVSGAVGKIVFEPEYRKKEALRGIDGYSHLWLIWRFSEAEREEWSPTVRPPRLGGNKRVGVFATRSPFRPNPIGLSSVKLIGIEEDKELGCCLLVEGVDMLNGTPIYDIKPYLTFTDSHPEAVCGFADGVKEYESEVVFPPELLQRLPENQREPLIEILKQDPRPSYKRYEDRSYGMKYSELEIFFTAEDGVIKVTDIK